MKIRNIKVNAVLNVIRTLMSVIFPLISYPYVLRILDADGVGKVSYVSSVIAYFSMFAMLGVSTYAVREGARIRDDKEKFTKFVSQVFSINVLSTIISCVCLLCAVLLVNNFSSYRLIFFILSFTIIFQVFSIDWVNTIFEDFAFITVRTIFVYIINIVLLFIFVKKPEDYIIYAILTAVPSGVVCLTNWFYCRRYVKIKLTTDICLNKHLKPLLILFANAIAISVYVNFDITMLGWFKGDYDAGIYTVSGKVYHVAKAVMASIYAVTVPRLSSYVGRNDYSKYKALYSKTWGMLSLVLIPASVGLVCFSQEIIYVFGGSKYTDAILPLQILSCALIFAIFGGLITACLNITIGKEKKNLIATIVSALVNFGLNFIFIPFWGVVGAAITTAISEFIVLLICFIKIENKDLYLDKKVVTTNILHSLIGAVVVVVGSIALKSIIHGTLLRIIVIIPSIVVVYALLLCVIKNQIFSDLIRQIINKMKGKLHTR